MSKERTGHPSQKPLASLERIVAASSDAGDMVLDPCLWLRHDSRGRGLSAKTSDGDRSLAGSKIAGSAITDTDHFPRR